jgi:hypothetical protein
MEELTQGHMIELSIPLSPLNTGGRFDGIYRSAAIARTVRANQILAQ